MDENVKKPFGKEATEVGRKVRNREYPINVKDGYFARNETEYRFDSMLRNDAKKGEKSDMDAYLSGQMSRNYLRRIMEQLDRIEKRLDMIEDAIVNHDE